MTTTSTRPALYQYRDGEIKATYEPANPHPVPIPAGDVLEAVRFLRGTLSYYETLDADLLAGMGLRILYRGAADWDMQTAHIPFHDVWTVVETIQDVTEWTREGIEVRPGGYKEVADEIVLTYRLTLALDAYDVATYAITDEESAAEATEEPEPRDTMEVLRRIFRHDGYDNFMQAVQGLAADGTIDAETATALGRIATHLQRTQEEDDDDTEETTAPAPPEQPPLAVEAFWTLAQYFKSKGVNVERVAEAVVANMTPAT